MNDTLARWESRFEIPVLIAALLVIPIIVMEQSATGEPWRTIAAIGNWTTWAVFLAEVVVLAAVAPDRRRWLLTHPLDVAIVVLTPPLLPASLQAARILRVLRLLQLIRAAKIAQRVFTLEGVRHAALPALLTALGGGALFANAEGREISLWDGVWWSVTTMTTVGYGDLYPHTTLGRVVAMAVMVVGIGFIAILTAALAERFVVHDVRAELERAELEIEGEVAETEADLVQEIREIGARLRLIEERLTKPE